VAKKSERVEVSFEGKDKLSPVMGKLGGGMGKMIATAGAMGIAFMGVQKAVETLGNAMKKLTDVMKQSVALAGEQERVEQKLAAAMKAAGIYTEEAYKANLKMASSFQNLSIYGDEAVIAVQSVLASMGGLSGPIMEDAVSATLNLAATWGMDLNAAAMQVAKAAGGYTSALSRYGVQLDKALPESEKFAKALEIINSKMGGAYQAQADTYTGRIRQLQNAWGDFLEKLGDFVVKSPEVQAALRIFAEMVRDLSGAVVESSNSIQVLVGTIMTYLMEAFFRLADIGRELAFALSQVSSTLGIIAGISPEVTAELLILSGRLDILSDKMAAYRERWIQLVEEFKKAKEEIEEAIPSPLPKETAEEVRDWYGWIDEYNKEYWEKVRARAEYVSGEIKARFEAAEAAVNELFIQPLTIGFTNATDRLVDAMWDTKAQFKDIWNMMLRDFIKGFLRRMVAEFMKAIGQMIAAQLAMEAATGFFGLFGKGGQVPPMPTGQGTYEGFGKYWRTIKMGGWVLPKGIKRLATGSAALGIDNIPALLAKDEFVVNAPASRAHRPWLEHINREGLRGYARGGPVAPSSPVVNVHITATDAASFETWMTLGDGRKILQSAFDRGHYSFPREDVR
jgi:hypothetical protein